MFVCVLLCTVFLYPYFLNIVYRLSYITIYIPEMPLPSELNYNKEGTSLYVNVMLALSLLLNLHFFLSRAYLFKRL